MSDHVVNCLNRSLVHAILSRYAHTSHAIGSQMGSLGLGSARACKLQQEWCATVASKLARTPHVERALWLSEAADWLRNVAEYLDRRGQVAELAIEHPALRGVVTEFRADRAAIERECARMMRAEWYGVEIGELCAEFAACVDDDPMFLRVAEAV